MAATAILAAVGYWLSRTPRVDPPSLVSQTNAPSLTNQLEASSKVNPVFEKLKGRWWRPDGGYILEVRNVEAGGKLDAAYLNPQPIHVSKAEASQVGASVKVFVELRDVNYPGSTYNLLYQPGSDQLLGIYYQAAIQQQFEVFFERLK